MRKKSKNSNYRNLRRFVYTKTSLFRYILLSIFDFILWIIKVAATFLIPLFITFLAGVIIVALGIKTIYDDALAWGLFGGALGFFGVTVSVLAIVRGINKEYFKVNSLKIFGSYKLFGLYDYYLLWVGSVLFAIGSLVSSIIKDISAYPCAITSFLYTVFTIATYLYIFAINDKNKYIKYLKNSGALRIKKRSSKMDQSVIFSSRHPKFKKVFSNFWVVTSAGQYSLHNKIKDYFNDIYSSRDGSLVNNVKLLKIYFEEFSKYLSTDIDLILITDLIESMNEKLIENLEKDKEFAIMKDILESMLVLSAEIFVSDYFRNEINIDIDDLKKEKKIKGEKYKKMIAIYIASKSIHLSLFEKLFDAVAESFDRIKSIKSNDKSIIEVKKDLLPVFETYKQKYKNKE